MTTFYDTLLSYIRVYGRTMVREFYDYWRVCQNASVTL
jgi:hypothetical protein